MTFNKRASLLALLAASLFGGAAQAGVVAGSEPLGMMYGSWSNQANSQNFLVQFTLGSDTTLTGFDIFTYRSFASVGSGVSVKIRADNGGAPAGTNLYQFDDTVDSETAFDSHVDISSVAFAGPTLAAGTYWMGVSGLVSELSWVSFTGNGTVQPGTQAQLSRDVVTRTPEIYSLAYRIQGDAAGHDVPEPASWALAAVALAGLGISRRRAAR